MKDRGTISAASPYIKKGVLTSQNMATIRKLAESVDIFGGDDTIVDRIAFSYPIDTGDDNQPVPVSRSGSAGYSVGSDGISSMTSGGERREECNGLWKL